MTKRERRRMDRTKLGASTLLLKWRWRRTNGISVGSELFGTLTMAIQRPSSLVCRRDRSGRFKNLKG